MSSQHTPYRIVIAALISTLTAGIMAIVSGLWFLSIPMFAFATLSGEALYRVRKMGRNTAQSRELENG